MRLDLGLLQMEFCGRPDGQRPHGFESLLEYYQKQLEDHIRQNGDDEGFCLDSSDCSLLQNESLQYYYRYLSLYHLKKYEAVENDTARNLKVFDLIKEYAESEEDKLYLERYRPYVIMMNTRAVANRMLEKNQPDEAIEYIEDAIERIDIFFNELHHSEMTNRCSEIVFLNNFAEEIRSNWSVNPISQLREKMRQAVELEDYQAAASIRDEIKKLI
jgi:tetratricopeptide (TPR) repeat protein